jgi:hypothetical protein
LSPKQRQNSRDKAANITDNQIGNNLRTESIQRSLVEREAREINGSKVSIDMKAPLLSEKSEESITLTTDERMTRGVYRFQFSSTSSLAGSAFCLTFVILIVFAFLMGLPAVLKFEASVTPGT